MPEIPAPTMIMSRSGMSSGPFGAPLIFAMSIDIKGEGIEIIGKSQY